jgi:hypothetical protein
MVFLLVMNALACDFIDSISGAAGHPHDRLEEAGHFLQDDQGAEIARRLVDFSAAELPWQLSASKTGPRTRKHLGTQEDRKCSTGQTERKAG